MRDAASPRRTGADRIVGVLEIKVHDDSVDWHLKVTQRHRDVNEEHGRADVRLSDRRKATIDLLADLLRKAEDLGRLENFQDDLYQDLIEVVGHELFELLFPDPIARATVAKQLKLLRDRDLDLLRVRLIFDGRNQAWLTGLPWEYARTPVGDEAFDHSQFLAQAAELVLSRRLQFHHSRPLGGAPRPVPVVFICSSPKDDPDERGTDGKPLLTKVEPTGILEHLEQLHKDKYIDLHALVEVWPDHPRPDYTAVVTHQRVAELVDEVDPVIVHFMGHGRSYAGCGELAFAQDDGIVNWVKDDEFADLVQGNARFKLALLQACESGLPADPFASFSGVAQRLAAAGLPAVVAMQYRVKSATANMFAAAFYDALLTSGEAVPIDYAVERGRRKIWNSPDRRAFGLPVVYLSSDNALTDNDARPPHPLRTPTVERNDTALDGRSCPRCATRLPSDARFCRQCGLRFACANCETAFVDPEHDRFCQKCGLALQQTPHGKDVIEAPQAPRTTEETAPARAALSVLKSPGTAG